MDEVGGMVQILTSYSRLLISTAFVVVSRVGYLGMLKVKREATTKDPTSCPQNRDICKSNHGYQTII